MIGFIKHVASYFSKPVEVSESTEAPEKHYRHIGLDAVAVARYPEEMEGEQKAHPFELPKPLPGVLPKGHKGMAMDIGINGVYAYAAQNTIFNEGIMAYPYAYLSELSQRAEYRNASEIISKEMTREWITLQAVGEEDKTDKIKQIEAAMTRYDLRGMVRKALELDNYFGRGHLYIDLDNVDVDDNAELAIPLRLSPAKIPKHSLKGFKIVEPMWTYPNDYDSINPLKDSYYKPQSWFVMGQVISATRMITFVTRPVSDLLKPAYQFGGLSLTQMMKPYVDNWLRTRQSISDLIHSFSINGIMTEMGDVLNAGSMQMLHKRIAIFNAHRDNRGVMLLDKNTEEFFNVSVPLTTLDALQAQSQEQMGSVTRIPISVLLGITPTGLNASSDSETRTFGLTIQGMQESGMTYQIKYALDVIQLSEFGAIDEGITFKFNPLWTLSEKELAEVRKYEAETDVIFIDGGVISPEEARTRVANQEDSPYHGLDPADVPEPPQDEMADEDLLKPGADEKESK